MKRTTVFLITAAASLLGIFIAQGHSTMSIATANPPNRTQNSTPAVTPLVHFHNAFQFTVHAPMSAAFPLFGAERERVWAGESWDPQFVYPQPAKDVLGAVFLIAHGHKNAVWVNTAFVQASGHVQYVYVIPGVMTTLIDIRLTAGSATNTKVDVVYERTSLAVDANEHVLQMGKNDSSAGKEWEEQINGYLARRAAAK